MEWESLRKEQEFLKGCQLRYFLLSITSVVAFVGLLNMGPNNIHDFEHEIPWIFLSPLMIIIPCWLIYFDKAKSIGRIVGYLMILEELLLSQNNNVIDSFIGWERSLAKFRHDFITNKLNRNDNVYDLNFWDQAFRLIFLRSTNKYWTFHFYAFAAASFMCLLLSTTEIENAPKIFWASVAIFICVMIYTFEQLRRLVFGRNSYIAHERKWRETLLEQIAEEQRVE